MEMHGNAWRPAVQVRTNVAPLLRTGGRDKNRGRGRNPNKQWIPVYPHGPPGGGGGSPPPGGIPQTTRYRTMGSHGIPWNSMEFHTLKGYPYVFCCHSRIRRNSAKFSRNTMNFRRMCEMSRKPFACRALPGSRTAGPGRQG